MSYIHVNDGKHIPDYKLHDFDCILQNDVAHLVRWKGISDVKPLESKPLRLKIAMLSAKLYAF